MVFARASETSILCSWLARMNDAPHVARARLSEMLSVGSRMLMPICSVSLMETSNVCPWRSVMIGDFLLYLFLYGVVVQSLACIFDRDWGNFHVAAHGKEKSLSAFDIFHMRARFVVIRTPTLLDILYIEE